jgi:hypothetical protein
MFIDLSWTNLNSVATTLKIYRGDAPLDRANLPADPIVTLSNGELSYRDETNIVLGKTYYYVFVTGTGSDAVVSQNYQVTAVTRRGPGPQNLLQGNNTLGYFGTLQSGEFISGSDLVTRLNMAGTATAMQVGQSSPLWHKFVRNNKILIIPEGPIAYGISWQQLYTLGMVYGTDDKGPGVPPTPNVNQSAKVKIGPDTFRVRLMKGMTDAAYTDYVTAITFPNEYSDILMPLAHPVLPEQRLENLYLNGRRLYQLIGLNGAVSYLHVQELNRLSYNNLRGQSTSTADENADTSSSLAFLGSASLTQTSSYGWLPVLELIEG